MAYNTSWMDTSTTMTDIVIGANAMANNVFILMLLSALWMLVFFRTNEEGTSNGVIVASFVTTIISILFWFMELLTWEILTIPIILMIVGIVVKYFE